MSSPKPNRTLRLLSNPRSSCASSKVIKSSSTDFARPALLLGAKDLTRLSTATSHRSYTPTVSTLSDSPEPSSSSARPRSEPRPIWRAMCHPQNRRGLPLSWTRSSSLADCRNCRGGRRSSSDRASCDIVSPLIMFHRPTADHIALQGFTSSPSAPSHPSSSRSRSSSASSSAPSSLARKSCDLSISALLFYTIRRILDSISTDRRNCNLESLAC